MNVNVNRVLDIDPRENGLPRWIRSRLGDLRTALRYEAERRESLAEELRLAVGKVASEGSNTFVDTNDTGAVALGKNVVVRFVGKDRQEFEVSIDDDGVLHVDGARGPLIIAPVFSNAIRITG